MDVQMGPLARRYAMACAHHRDNIPASGNMSSPSSGGAGSRPPHRAPGRRGRAPGGAGGTGVVGGKGCVLFLYLLAAPVGTHPLTRMCPAVGTIFVFSACVGQSMSESRAAKEPPMKQPHTCSVTPTHASTPDAQSLPYPRTPMPTRRVSRCVSFALGLALGTGVAVLFSLLSTWFSA